MNYCQFGGGIPYSMGQNKANFSSICRIKGEFFISKFHIAQKPKVGSSLCPIIIIIHILLDKENNHFCCITDRSKLVKGLVIFISFYPIYLHLDEIRKKSRNLSVP